MLDPNSNDISLADINGWRYRGDIYCWDCLSLAIEDVVGTCTYGDQAHADLLADIACDEFNQHAAAAVVQPGTRCTGCDNAL